MTPRWPVIDLCPASEGSNRFGERSFISQFAIWRMFARYAIVFDPEPPDRSKMGRGKDFRDRRRGYSDEPPEPLPSFGRPPPRSFDRPPREVSRPVPTGPERQAKVKWFNGEKGFGFVELTDGSGEAFLHISVAEAAGHASLEPGTTLTVRVGQGAKGPQITEITAVDTSTAEPSRGGGGGARFGSRPPRSFD